MKRCCTVYENSNEHKRDLNSYSAVLANDAMDYGILLADYACWETNEWVVDNEVADTAHCKM